MTKTEKFYKDFVCWLNGLIEDDPIPYEISSLVFFVNNHAEIGMSGTETKQVKNIDYNFYFPLEAQYFYCIEFYNQKNFNIDKSLKFLEESLNKLKKDKYFGKFNLFFGKLFCKAKKI